MAKKQLNEAKQKLEALADYVDEILRQELIAHCCTDCTEDFCIDCAEIAFNNDYLRNLVNLRVELRERIEKEGAR